MDKPLQADPLVDALRLGRFWQATVLLRFSDPYRILPHPWTEVSAADWMKALADPRDLFHPDHQSQQHKQGTSSRVVHRRLQLGPSQPEVFCKLSHRRNFIRKVVGLIRRSRPSRNWQLAWMLLGHGIPTALPLALLQKKLFGLRVAAGIITQSLLPGKTLHDFACQDAPDLPPAQQLRLTKHLAALIRSLHQHDFFHRDLKGSNIFVHLAPSADPRFYLLDLDGCRHGRQDYLKKAKSLARLARNSLEWPVVRTTSRLRFLRAYLNGPEHPPDRWKEWWRDIDQQVRRKSRLRNHK